MKMNEENQEDLLMNESDEFLLNMTEQLKQELKDVKVSEELIAKTLKAVKIDEQQTNVTEKVVKTDEQQTNVTEKVVKTDELKYIVTEIKDTKASAPHKRNYMKYAAYLIEVAAACFVLVIGYNFISRIDFGGFDRSKSSNEAEKSIEGDSSYNASKGEPEYFSFSESATADQAESPAVMATQAPEYKGEFPASDVSTNMIDPETAYETLNPAITKAMEDVKLEILDESIIQIYQGETTKDQCSKLLLLFQSEALSLSSDDVTEEWRNLFILSTDDQSAILYKVGMKEYVVAQIYDTTGLKSETVYHVSDMAQLHQSIDEIINQ